MRTSFFTCIITCIITFIFASAPLAAHHSFAAEYDGKKPVTYSGVVTQIDWRNPHAYIFMDIKDDAGTHSITIEGHPPNILRRTGWGKDLIHVQDAITVQGWASKDGTMRMAGREITLPGGKKLFWGPPSE